MKKQSCCFLLFFCLFTQMVHAQELYVYTEPASNMAKGGIGVRLTSRLMKMNDFPATRYRLEPEVMFGLSKNWMLHLNFFASDIYTGRFKAEAAGLYAKYRFLSKDEVHAHFRMAAFLKGILSNNPSGIPYKDLNGDHIAYSNFIDLDGSNSGIQTGLIATKLKNKLAVSSSLSYVKAMANSRGIKRMPWQPPSAANYSLSAGYLLFPKEYVSYRQLNMNLYVEALGQTPFDGNGTFIDVNPALQFIFNSIARLDIGAQLHVQNNRQRMEKNNFLLRFEYNFLNAMTFKHK
jgi:hypothetical protein